MKNKFLFFVKDKRVSKILGIDYPYTDIQKTQITEFFEYYNDGDRSGIWRKNIALWIKHGLDNWILRRTQLLNTTSNSKEWMTLMYGDSAEVKIEEQKDKLIQRLPSRIDYWLNIGKTPDEAFELVKNHQKKAANKKIFTRKMSPRCEEYWISKGYSLSEAKILISNIQKRDKDFYTQVYGEEGTNRYKISINKRKETWKNKDKREHGRKTAPKVFNPNGHEMQAINGFLNANNISVVNCKFGSPKDQFWQYIPKVGYRRYDLAVFTDNTHTKLIYILEYHGPGHINFSEYVSELENEPITIGGKKLAHLGTYGQVYHNDLAKRNHILEKFPEVKYIVMWNEDLKNKRFLINEYI